MPSSHFDKNRLPAREEALPGRTQPIATAQNHFVNGRPLKENWQEPLRTVLFGMGCFWGVERLFWKLPGVYVTAAGYSGGFTPNPTYEEVCSGRTGHTEVVLVVYDNTQTALETLLKTFWEEHDPTQAMRQGNDIGSNYRSAIYLPNQQDERSAMESRDIYAQALAARGLGTIVTEIRTGEPFYYAEDYHQQYLAKNPQGYCGLQGTGVSCLIGLGVRHRG
ncbi:MAG: Peptide methionine sulfoxide reductase MsrA [Candidatus Tokpelaia hoelldobleri]|uniref:Peptide methionine sulfoxide reductase MsrA n=1 Tax=Candidatus Tokpelaia hoelldobleri TaxID=1902579 RepID=A0A1U9JVN1_9HYPH|nr:MAG: Peptide methionine sulfoxide reductase MsrA [Candidatus Tokpelaia hoelldoblerii]